MKYFGIILCLLAFISGCNSSKKPLQKDNEQSSVDMKNEQFLSKNEIREFVDIISQEVISKEERDSLTTLIFDRIHDPMNFDSIHRAFNLTQAPNLANPSPTIDEWNAYDGDIKIWEITNLDYLPYEFRLTGSIDGFSGVLSTIQSSKHGHTINTENLAFDRYEFDIPMKELNERLKETHRMLVSYDLTVAVIKIEDLERFKNIIGKTKWGKITTYNKA